MPEPGIDPGEVLRFWFEELDESDWFGGCEDVDRWIAERFGALHAALAKEVPDRWLATREGVLAAIIVLDQFSRNLHRDDAAAYANDSAALSLAHLAIERGWDADYDTAPRQFLYMPFMHVEDERGQARSVELFAELGDAETLKFAEAHRDVIDRFGRFPGRNAALGRQTTAAEQAYLGEGGGF
ncbi:MAG: DUF924 family protein [Pacificimonas sp.]